MDKITMQKNPQTMTMNQLFKKFIFVKELDNLSVESISYYLDCFKFFSNFLNADTPCSEITSNTILEYINYLKTNTKIKDITINTRIRGMRALLYYGMEHGYVKPFKIRMIKTDKEIKETYTDDELLILLKKPDIKTCSFTEYRNWVIVNYLLATGNRLSTLINLKIEDIAFSDGMIMLKKVKNRKQQIIPLSNTMIKILREYIEFRQGEPDDYLFCNRFGKQFTKSGFQATMKDFNHSRGLTKTSIHLFRHTFAKKWILNGGDIFRLQKILGHSSIEIVKEYVNIFGTELQQQFNEFNPLENLYSENGLHSNKSLTLTKKQKNIKM